MGDPYAMGEVLNHDPFCELAPYAERIAEGGIFEAGYLDDHGSVQYRGCQCTLIARVRADEQSKVVNVNWASTKRLLADERDKAAGRVDADTLAAWIRTFDGSHSLGAGELAERLVGCISFAIREGGA